MHEYVCGQHALFGMSASWEVATATQITRSGATTTGTLAIQLADHIGGSGARVPGAGLITESDAEPGQPCDRIAE
jgi:hypothetical protein